MCDNLIKAWGFEGYYVTSNGNVYSAFKGTTQIIDLNNIHPISKYKTKKGYEIVKLCSKSKQQNIKVHRLIWMSFNKKEIPKKKEIDHIDGNRANNNIENLRLVSHLENIHFIKGKNGIKKVKATNIYSGEILLFNSTMEPKTKGFSQSCVSLACRGKYYNGHIYKDFIWEFVK